MLPKKARRQRALSVPTTEPDRASISTQRNAQSASAITKHKTFFPASQREQGDETGSAALSPPSVSLSQVSPMRQDTAPPPPPPLPPRSPRVTYADQRPHSSRAYSDKRPLISPRVFNFYELSPAMELRRSEAGGFGSKNQPIVLTDEPGTRDGSSQRSDAVLRGMASKRLDVGGGKLDTHFVCNICSKICGSQAQLIIHQQQSHKQTHMLHHWPNSEHYICNIESCNRRFSNAVLLQKHIEHEHVIPTPNLESPRRRISEGSDWSPVPQQSPSSPSSFKTPSSWHPPDSPAPSTEYFRSPTGSITSPLCRRSIGSEGGPFKPYNRSPGQGGEWRSSKVLVDEHVKYLQSLRDTSQVTQYITQQVLAQQQSLADSQLHSANNKLLLDHHIVQQTGSGLLAPSSPFFQSRSITFDVSSPNILAPQPIKHSPLGILKRRHTSSESSAVNDRAEVDQGARQFSRNLQETRVETPEPSPNLPDTKPSILSPGSLENVFIDVEPGTISGLDLLGQVSSQLSRLNEGEPVKNKSKPAPLDLPSDPHFTLTPPYTGTPRYLWTPTKSVTLPPSSFFSMEPKKIRIGDEFQATIPDLVTGPDDRRQGEGPMTPVYTPPADEKEDDKREIFFKHTIPVYPDSEFLHHCVHATGGDLQEACKLARCPVQPKLSATHPLHNYRYNGRYRWTLDDQERFLLLFQRFGRNLALIAKWMPDKKIADIVEYYYFWKVRYPDVYKQWRNQQNNCRLSQPPTTTEYDQKVPPTKPNRRQSRKEIVYFETEAYTTHDAKGNKEIKFRQKKVVNPYTVSPRPRSNKPPNPQPLGSYKCKVCGKEFQKVKSRSAHMKTHKRQQNAVALLATPTLLQQQYQLHSQQQQLHQQLQAQLKHLTPDSLAPPASSAQSLELLLSRDPHDIRTTRDITMTSRDSITDSRDVVMASPNDGTNKGNTSQNRTDNSAT
ncbi:uncharacterized protein LOC134818375 isoform X2 [Bolinopsis microptera]|uniref:uncharacterized protein LOC134818375 isoform X2 n=1 Tax=Bolinopsis microptera TaxID=2820187 RepID=UPI0030798495